MVSENVENQLNMKTINIALALSLLFLVNLSCMKKRVFNNRLLFKNESSYPFTVTLQGKDVPTKSYLVNKGKTVYVEELNYNSYTSINKYVEIAVKNSQNKQKLHFNKNTSNLGDSVGINNPKSLFNYGNFKYSFTDKSDKSCPRYNEIVITDSFF